MFLLVSMSSIVLSQNRYHVDKTTFAAMSTFALTDTVVRLKYDMKPINGVLYCDYGDMGIYVEGKNDGLHRGWWSNQQLSSKCNYKDGKRDGLCRYWYENGQLSIDRNYKDGKRGGLDRYWYENGQLWWHQNYKDGKKDGLWRQWNEDGILWSEHNY